MASGCGLRCWPHATSPARARQCCSKLCLCAPHEAISIVSWKSAMPWRSLHVDTMLAFPQPCLPVWPGKSSLPALVPLRDGQQSRGAEARATVPASRGSTNISVCMFASMQLFSPVRCLMAN